MKIIGIMIFLLLTIFQICLAEIKDNKIFKIANYGDKIITSSMGNLTYEWIRVDSTSTKALEDDKKTLETKGVIQNYFKYDIFFAHSGPKIRCNTSSMEMISNNKWAINQIQSAYNGEKTDRIMLYSFDENGLFSSQGFINQNNVITIKKFDPRYNGIYLFNTPIESFLKGSPISLRSWQVFGEGEKEIIKNLQFIGDEIINRIHCKIFSGYTKDNSVNIKVWLSKKFFYRPTKIEVITSKSLMISYIDFKKYEYEIWFPKKIINEFYYMDESKKEFVIEKKSTLLVHDDFNINIDVPEDLFDIEFPKGIKIYDERINQSIVAK